MMRAEESFANLRCSLSYLHLLETGSREICTEHDVERKSS